ncbi:carbohydrate ABC transporter permease [Fundicoccus culcitae]|uniref:Sugar ABC transporter permease n=1 Tax=Fundicoccus culcitae TaxID=2969821 RepID=A0ABY5P8B2_9LACT|nr:sugar ABC transporter permease [Fundicoccus culcitae]UUX34988.1 sugar ABC transporter permease [Fundicoccus culcitae]
MNKKLNRLTNLKGYLFISPWMIGFAILTLFPFVYSIYLSFHSVRITSTGIQTQPVQFQNFQQAITGDIEFINRMVNFLREIFIAVPLIVILALIIAVFLNQPIRFKGFFRTLYFLPVIISSGPVLDKLIGLGITSIPFVDTDPLYIFLTTQMGSFLGSVITYIVNNIIILLWFSGVQILIFISALQKVDKQVYEAAAIDGASGWEAFWKITLPSLYPMILVNIIYTTVMYSVSGLNEVIDHIQANMFQIETGFGYSSALSWLYFLMIIMILLVFVGILWFFSRRSSTR